MKDLNKMLISLQRFTHKFKLIRYKFVKITKISCLCRVAYVTEAIETSILNQILKKIIKHRIHAFMRQKGGSQ